MIRKIFLLIMCVFLFLSCGDKEREAYDTIPFSEALTSLIIEDTDLETISKSTQISQKDLILMKYGLIKENEEITNYLRDLKYAYDKEDESDIEDLLEDHHFEIVNKRVGKPVPKEKYKAQEYLNNEKFQEKLHNLGERFYNRKVEKVLNKRLSFWGKIKTGWEYMFSSRESFVSDFKNELHEQFLSESISDYLQKRINAYTNMLVSEHLFLYGHKEKMPQIKLVFENGEIRVDFDEDSEKTFLTETAYDTMDKVDVNFVYIIIDGFINGIINSVSEDNPYEDTQDIIHEQIKDFMNSFDIWILSDLNKLTQNI